MQNRLIIAFVLVVMLCCISHIDLMAQCPMCKVAAESNLENGGTAGKGLNKGILYIFVMPYLLVCAIGFIWWKNKKADDCDNTAKWN